MPARSRAAATGPSGRTVLRAGRRFVEHDRLDPLRSHHGAQAAAAGHAKLHAGLVGRGYHRGREAQFPAGPDAQGADLRTEPLPQLP